jgi:hypothetical protein
MSTNPSRLLLREAYEESEWFGFRNINKWIEKFWKPRIIGMYVGKYGGEWKDGQMHGMGTLRISRIIRGYLFGWKLIDEGEYVGEWKNGKENGKGIRFYRAGLMNNDNGKYEGEWRNGLEHGHGTKTWPGEWKNVKKYGNGIGIFWDAGKYEGEWRNGLEHGHGTKTWPDGKKFIGKWNNGKYFHGTYYFDNGDKHFGYFKDGVAKGHGIRTYFDGRKHTGEFKCREEQSEGTCILTGKNTVRRFIESIPTGFDTNKNYIGCEIVKYKEEKRASLISYFFYI